MKTSYKSSIQLDNQCKNSKNHQWSTSHFNYRTVQLNLNAQNTNAHGLNFLCYSVMKQSVCQHKAWHCKHGEYTSVSQPMECGLLQSPKRAFGRSRSQEWKYIYYVLKTYCIITFLELSIIIWLSVKEGLLYSMLAKI